MPDNYSVTLAGLANSINPNWTLDDWMQWPPDMFALCATILNRTGAYKLALIDTDWWNRKDWDKDVKEAGKLWIKQTSNRLLGNAERSGFKEKSILGDCYQRFKSEWDENKALDIDQLRILGDLYKNKEQRTTGSEALRTLAEALVKMYILADASCSGLGFLGQSLKKENLENRIFMVTANLLLNNTGSLSTINKFHGVVVPKMRTPQSGLIVRALGHHLTFHTSEVEIIWRTFPRLEDSNRSLNIMAVPYPKQIVASDFTVVPDNYHPVRYFKGNFERIIEKDFFVGLVKKVWDLAEEQSRVDIIVFPEMALTEKQYEFLLYQFKLTFELQEGQIQLPTIVCGIMKENVKNTGYAGADDTFNNEVRMGVFFSGRWYTTTQRKHHRWQLDRSQIHQYQLEGHLASDRRWFEFASITQRRLTILAPNSWLALTALICEDLARQEPVGEVIRGIGPTLLMALLSDGPQLKNRWSARYASVLADDPGTAVLSLTSLGMALRSVAPEGTLSSDEPIVGLWKDMIGGWKELGMDKNHQALLFTISAKFEEEFTLDARSDGGAASVFQMENIKPVAIKFDLTPTEESEPILKEIENEEQFNNIRELSALQFASDAMLDMICGRNMQSNNFAKSVQLILSLLSGHGIPPSSNQKFRNRIIEKIEAAWIDPSKVGIAASPGKDGKVKMKAAARDFNKIIVACESYNLSPTADLYDVLIETCERMLRDKSRTQDENLTPMSILYNLYNRITSWHPSEKDCFEIDGLTVKRAQEMIKAIKEHINGEAESIAKNESSKNQID